MQTFISDTNLIKNFLNLDNKRLGKQRRESVFILEAILKQNKEGYKNHPAVKMWKGYEGYLLFVYLFVNMKIWKNKNFNNVKTQEDYEELSKLLLNKFKCFLSKLLPFIFIRKLIWKKPPWITKEFIEAHRSKLIRKKPEHYRSLFPDTKEGLEYIWPI